MLKRVTFLSRPKAAALKPPAGCALISVYDRSEPQLQPQPGWSRVLYLRFHDTDGGQMGLEVFSEAQAQQALDFVRELSPDVDHLVIHCQAGQSRSAGLALFFAETLSLPCFKDTTPVTSRNYPLYNRKVYGVLLRTADEEPQRRYLDWAGY